MKRKFSTTPAPPLSASIESAYLPEDLLLLVTGILVKSRDVGDLVGLGSASRFFRSAVEERLFEKAYLGTPNGAGRMHKETQDVGAYVKHFHVQVQSSIAHHAWKMPPPAPLSFWRILSENFINLTTLIIEPPQPRTLVDLDPPRYDPTLHHGIRQPFLPNLKRLEMPYNQIAMLKILTHCPKVEEVALTVVDNKAIHCYNMLARKQDNLAGVLDAHAPLPVQVAVGGGVAMVPQIGTWSTNLQQLYYVVSPVKTVKKVCLQAHLGLRLEDAAEFSRRLFPNVEELNGFNGGVPGHVTHITHNLLNQMALLPNLTSLTTVFASPGNALGQNLALRCVWGVDERLLPDPEDLDFSSSPDPQTPLTPNNNIPRFSSRGTTVSPNSELIQTTLDPLIVQLGRQCPALREIRHIYDDGINWCRDRRKVWEFQGLIEGREAAVVVEKEEGVEEVEVQLVEEGEAAQEETGQQVVQLEEVVWKLRIVPMGLTQGCDYI